MLVPEKTAGGVPFWAALGCEVEVWEGVEGGGIDGQGAWRGGGLLGIDGQSAWRSDNLLSFGGDVPVVDITRPDAASSAAPASAPAPATEQVAPPAPPRARRVLVRLAQSPAVSLVREALKTKA